MTSVRIWPNQICVLCSQRLLARGEPCVLLTPSERIFHERCLHTVFPAGNPPGTLLERGRGGQRVLEIQATGQIKRWVYIVAIAASILAFGILTAVSSALIVTETATTSGYLIAKGIDYYASSRARRIVQFH